jgi:hypothetical protein
MKRIFALALVSLLSISSLANQEPKLLINKFLPTSESNCPAEYVFIEGNSEMRGFCITKSVQTPMRLSLAKENCKEQVHDGKKAYLCGSEEWFLACKKNGEELIMLQKNSGKLEWVDDRNEFSFGFGQVMGFSRCDKFIDDYFSLSIGSRCCFR